MSKKQEAEQRFDLQLPAEAGAKFANASHRVAPRSSLMNFCTNSAHTRSNWRCRTKSCAVLMQLCRHPVIVICSSMISPPLVILPLQRIGLIAEANLTCSTLLGVERDKLINCRFAKYLLPEDSDRWHLHCLHAKQHRAKQNCELTLRRADDTFFQARLDSLYTEAPDSPPLMHITLTDITERKQTEEALRES